MVVAVWDPRRGKPVFFRLLVMPFGARHSVFGFVGFGLALQMIGCVRIMPHSSEHVDDFIQVGMRADVKAW